MVSHFLQALHFGNIVLFPLLEVLNIIFSQHSPSKTPSVGSLWDLQEGTWQKLNTGTEHPFPGGAT